MQTKWTVVLLFLGLAFAQDYEDYFNIFEDQNEVSTTAIPATTTATTTTTRPTTTTTPTTTTILTTTTKASTTTTRPTTTTTRPTTNPKLLFIEDVTQNERKKNEEVSIPTARLENIFLKAFKNMNMKIDKIGESLKNELSKIYTQSTTTTTTTTTTTPPPSQVVKFLDEDVFEEEFFNSKDEANQEEEESSIIEWINGNLKVVAGVCILVGSLCLIIPTFTTICWYISKKLEKRKSNELEMIEMDKEKEENTEVEIETNVDETSPVYNDVPDERPLPPIPANATR